MTWESSEDEKRREKEDGCKDADAVAVEMDEEYSSAPLYLVRISRFQPRIAFCSVVPCSHITLFTCSPSRPCQSFRISIAMKKKRKIVDTVWRSKQARAAFAEISPCDKNALFHNLTNIWLVSGSEAILNSKYLQDCVDPL